MALERLAFRWPVVTGGNSGGWGGVSAGTEPVTSIFMTDLHLNPGELERETSLQAGESLVVTGGRVCELFGGENDV